MATDAFRELVVAELAETIYLHKFRMSGTAVGGGPHKGEIKLAEAIADRLTCPECGFIDIGIGNPPRNVCNDCAPRQKQA